MEKEDDGYAEAVRLEKAKPTQRESSEFAVLVIALVLVMLCVFGMAIIGAAMIFWRILG